MRFFYATPILMFCSLLLLPSFASGGYYTNGLDMKWLKKRGFDESIIQTSVIHFFGQWDLPAFRSKLKYAISSVNRKNGTYRLINFVVSKKTMFGRVKKEKLDRLTFTLKKGKLHGRVSLVSDYVDIKAYFIKGKLHGRFVTVQAGNFKRRTQCRLRYRQDKLHGKAWCLWGVASTKIHASFYKGKLHGKTWIRGEKPRYFYKGRPCGKWKNPDNFRIIRFRCRRK